MRGPRPDDGGAITVTGGTVRLAALPGAGAVLRLEPDGAATETLRQALGLDGLRKVRLTGRLVPDGARDWRLDGTVGATVVQPCAVTLAPVTTRIDAPVTRRYVADWADPDPGTEVEMPADDSTEALPERLDLDALLGEALSLAVPLYPRAPQAEFGGLAVSGPGLRPMQDEDARPLAGLAALRDSLAGGGRGGDGGNDPG